MADDPRAQVVTDIWLQSTRLFFKLQALGKEIGAVAANNSSTWGFLHTLVTVGPSTVPDIARMRPVSRQHIQTMANDMAKKGLIQFVENPRHRRSKLLEITEKGHKFYEDNSAAMLAEAAATMGDLKLEDLVTTSAVLGDLHGALVKRLGVPVLIGKSEPATEIESTPVA